MKEIHERVSVRRDQDRPVEEEKISAPGLPENQRAFALFAPGYPAESRRQQDRYDENRIYTILDLKNNNLMAAFPPGGPN